MSVWFTDSPMTKDTLHTSPMAEVVKLPTSAAINVELDIEVSIPTGISGYKYITIGNKFNGMSGYMLKTQVLIIEIS